MLTQKEKEVVGVLYRKSLPKQVGYEIGIHENTVKIHMKNIIRKLGLKNRTELLIAIRCPTTLNHVEEVLAK